MELAQLFEGEISIRRFLKRIEGMETGNEGEASLDNENSDVVKLITIHKSKGLEFPVVIVPELGYVKQSGRTKPNLLVDYESNQIALKDPVDEVSGSDYSKMLLREFAKESEEEKRILYVAFTRAERELVLSYSKPAKNKKNACFRKALIDCDILQENGKEDCWKRDSESAVNEYLEIIKPSALVPIDSGALKSQPYITNRETTIEIPQTVYALDEKEWKKYVSPTVLNAKKDFKKEQNLNEIATNYDYDEIKTGDAKTMGTLVHKVLEDLGKIPLSYITPERIMDKLVDEPALEDFLPDIKRVVKMLSTVNSPLINAIEQAEQIYSEIPIRKKFGKYILTGTIDKLFFSENEWKIVDFKYATGSKGDDEQYIFQIQFYLYCLQQLLSPQPRRGYIYYIKSNKIVDVHQSPNIEQLIAQQIESYEKMK